MTPKWEWVAGGHRDTSNGYFEKVERMPVPGGWVYKIQQFGDKPDVTVFVPRPSLWSRLFGWRIGE